MRSGHPEGMHTYEMCVLAPVSVEQERSSMQLRQSLRQCCGAVVAELGSSSTTRRSFAWPAECGACRKGAFTACLARDRPLDTVLRSCPARARRCVAPERVTSDAVGVCELSLRETEWYSHADFVRAWGREARGAWRTPD
jgi:hypothetical protein